MAKSKKSKILAMALCASVMTGIYASPVMAAGQISGINVTGGTGAGLEALDTVIINGVKLEIQPDGMHGIVKAAGGEFTQLTVTNGMEITGGVLTVGGTSIDSTTGNTSVGGTLTVGGLASLNGGLTVTVGGNLNVTGESTLKGGLTVTGETTLEKTTVNGTLTAGATDVDSLTVNTDKFVVDADGNTTVGGTLKVTGAAKVDSLEVANGIKAAGGTFKLTEEGKLTVGAADNQTIIEGGAITAESLVLKGKDVGKTIFGIERDPENDVTTIEGATSFDANGMSIKDVEDFGTSLGVAGMEITADDGLSTSFTAGGATFVDASGTTTINGGAIVTTKININGVDFTQWHDEVDDRLDVLENKTQNIKPGTGTGTGTGAGTGEGGAAAGEGNNIIEVPVTEDGTTGINGNVTVGGNITAGTGNIGGVGMEKGTITTGDTTIDGDGIKTGNGNFTGEVTVGDGTDKTTINGGTITTGGTTIDGSGIETGNGTFTGDVEITGNITADTGNIGGIDMKEGTIKTGNTTINGSGMTITGKDGNTTNNISDKGMTVTGSNGTTNISGGDISVDNSVTVAGGSENKTTINNEGITVGDKGTSIKHDEISVGDGGYIGGGDVVSGEGVSLNQTAERVGHLENRVGELEDRIDKVGAMSAAIANLRTMGYDPAAPTEVAVGIGQYRDETGAALGLFHYPNRDFMLSLSVSTSGDEVMGGIGATWKFGRKSPEKVLAAEKEKAAKAKLAKAEAMKKAAKEAKIKAQQERHAKLAAERAAQAEAAK